MGISIHYRGKLEDMSKFPEFCEEIEDIANCMKWKCVKFDDDWSQPANAKLVHSDSGCGIQGNLGLRGVQITPTEDVEALSFMLDKEGNLRSYMNMISLCSGDVSLEHTWIAVKTQFGSPNTHIWIIGLLKYLKKKYFPNLEVHDEGDYWETGDRKILEQKMGFLNKVINDFKQAASSGSFGNCSDLSANEIADKLTDYFSDKYNKKE